MINKQVNQSLIDGKREGLRFIINKFGDKFSGKYMQGVKIGEWLIYTHLGGTFCTTFDNDGIYLNDSKCEDNKILEFDKHIYYIDDNFEVNGGYGEDKNNDIIKINNELEENLNNNKEEIRKQLIFGGFWERFSALIIDIGLSFLIIPLVLNIYYYFTEGDTIGYKVFGLKILNKTNLELPSLGTLFFRKFAKILSILPFFLGYIRSDWDKEKQTFHDKICNTIVIKYKSTNRLLEWILILISLFIIAIVGGGS